MDFQLFTFTGAFLCLIYFMAGFLDSICGGGGILTVASLINFNIPTGLIIGTNQCATIIGNFAGMGRYIKNKKIHYPSAILATVLAMVGAVIGSRLNLLIPTRYLQIFMIGMIPVLTIIMLVKKDVGQENHIDLLKKRAILSRSAAIGLILGVYQGFYGPGCGTLYMLAFAIFLKLDLLTSTGNTRFLVSFASLAAGISYALSGAVIWNLAIAATVFNIIGSYVGAGFAIKKGSRIIRPLMFFVILLLFLKILADAVL